jgi:hypothetical protein
MNELVLAGLVKRRAQLAGDIENTHEAVRKMVLDDESLDATSTLISRSKRSSPRHSGRRKLVESRPDEPDHFEHFAPSLRAAHHVAILPCSYLSSGRWIRATNGFYDSCQSGSGLRFEASAKTELCAGSGAGAVRALGDSALGIFRSTIIAMSAHNINAPSFRLSLASGFSQQFRMFWVAKHLVGQIAPARLQRELINSHPS